MIKYPINISYKKTDDKIIIINDSFIKQQLHYYNEEKIYDIIKNYSFYPISKEENIIKLPRIFIIELKINNFFNGLSKKEIYSVYNFYTNSPLGR